MHTAAVGIALKSQSPLIIASHAIVMNALRLVALTIRVLKACARNVSEMMRMAAKMSKSYEP